MEQAPVELRKVRDFGEIISDTFLFVKQNWKPLLKTYLVICGFFVVASLLVTIFNQMRMVDTLTEYGTGYRRSPFASIFSFSYFLSVFLALIVYSIMALTCFSYIAIYVQKGNQTPTISEVWGFVKYYFFRFIGCAILLDILILLGFIFCIIPGFYLMPAMSLALPVMVMENAGFGYAVNRSFRLVKGNYWLTLGVIFIMLIIVITGMLVLTLPINLFTVGTMLVTGSRLTYTSVILSAIAQHICMVFNLLPGIGIAFTYYSLTEKAEGIGLMDRINNMGVKDNNSRDLPGEQY